MSRFLGWVQRFAVALGGPGLFLIGLLDSSFLSFPEVADVLIVVLVMEHPQRVLWYALMPTLGSIAGSYVLFWLGRRGGEAFLRKRVSERYAAMAVSLFDRYGFWAVAVPAILPPPMPFKIFVLAAGAAGMRPAAFLLSIAAGRSIRYFGEGLLAIWYGRAALDFMNEHVLGISIALVAVMGALSVGWMLWSKHMHHLDG